MTEQVTTRADPQHAPQAAFVDGDTSVAADPTLLGPDQVHPTVHGRDVLAAAVRTALTT